MPRQPRGRGVSCIRGSSGRSRAERTQPINAERSLGRVTMGGVINDALRRAPAVDLQRSPVEHCLDLRQPGDVRFHVAWTRSLDALAHNERAGALAGVTGHVAESVLELLLADVGYHPVWHFTGPGRHGVDLLMLQPITSSRSRSRARCGPGACRVCHAAPRCR